MPTPPHNKAPTADRLVAGGGFSFDVAQRQNAFTRQDTLYIGITDRSTRRFVRQRPEGSAFAHPRHALGGHAAQNLRHVRAPFGQGRCEKPVVFRFSSPLFREKPTFPKNAPAFLSPPRRRARPHGRGTGKNFTSPRRKCAEMRMRSPFFYFCLLSMREKHAIFASKTCFINSAWQKRGRSSPFFVSPPECPDTSLPSL